MIDLCSFASSGHFVAVAEERHFTRAAARVHVAQASLSWSVAALERELGEALFVQDNRRVALAPAGRALLPAARRPSPPPTKAVTR